MSSSPPSARYPALDRMRGLVMVLMVLDHAGAYFDAGHLAADSAGFPQLPLTLFGKLTRTVTHLCAPTFVFLAGTSLAISLARRAARGVSARELDRHLFVRGAILIALDPLLVTPVSAPGAGWMWIFQVLTAIGLSMWCMIALRRLPAPALGALGAFALLAGEWWSLPVWGLGGGAPNALLKMSWVPWFALDGSRVLVAWVYPLGPWLAMLALGWSYGSWLERGAGEREPARPLAALGALGVLGFLALRWNNGWGNMGLLRLDGSLAQWLHVSKYPPSASFACMSLGAMALLLALYDRLEQRWPARDAGPLIVFGQVPLFFYVVHLPLLLAVAWVSGRLRSAGLGATYLAWVGALFALYPLCAAYRAAKRRRPHSWMRYL